VCARARARVRACMPCVHVCVCACVRTHACVYHFNRMNDDNCVFMVWISKFVLHICGLFNTAGNSAVSCKVGG